MPKGGFVMLPLPEYPRPALRRESFVNLNGLWEYAITDSAQLPRQFEGEILVPYSPEAPASGVGRVLQPGQWLHYRRSFAPPPGEGGRVLLQFGAVDYECIVSVNGRLAGGHRGGYLPFTLDITDLLNPAGENWLWAAVQDPTDQGTQARGKQKLAPGGMYYTPQSGIWQTVWLERVPQQYIQSLTVRAGPDSGRVELGCEVSGGSARCKAEIWAEGQLLAEAEGPAEQLVLELAPEKRRLWSPEDPFLYDLTLTLPGGDRVESYFALRSVTVQPDARGILRLCLNGQPRLLCGLLDQGYWPQGLYTPPSDEAMVQEIQTAKELGFDLLRKHAKIEPQRWYYHCDRLGMLVWQDAVNGGGKYPAWLVTYLINIFQPLLRRLPDAAPLWPLLGRGSEASRAEYAAELEQMVKVLGLHPSICCWVAFNEGWGQFDAAGAEKKLRALDPTRLVDPASGWFDQGGGELDSLHNYFYPLRVKPGRRAVVLSEYGGISWPMPGHTTREKSYGYGAAKSRAELTQKYKKLMLGSVLPQLRRGLSALVYTQLTDIEEEVNGILTADRSVIKPDATAVRSVNGALRAEFARCTAPEAPGEREEKEPTCRQ